MDYTITSALSKLTEQKSPYANRTRRIEKSVVYSVREVRR
jgi:hypothetical protein